MNYICNMAYHTTTFPKCKQWAWPIYYTLFTISDYFSF